MIFVDTGAWIARFSRRDQHCHRATAIWEKLKASNEGIATSDCVFVETISFIGRKVSLSSAVEAGRFLHGWTKLTVLRTTREDESVALDLLGKFADQSIGFVDCLSFVLMRLHRISTAFTFDRHFEFAGFPLLG